MMEYYRAMKKEQPAETCRTTVSLTIDAERKKPEESR